MRLIAVMLLLCAGMVAAQQNPVVPDPKPTANSVTLAWGHSLDAVDSYRIYIGNAPGRYVNSFLVGYTTNATLTGLAWKSTNYFAAVAIDNGIESDVSNEVSYTVPDPPPPTIAISVERLRLEWSAYSNVNYTLQWSTNLTGTNWTTYATVLSGTNFTARYLVTNDTPRKFWRVRL